MACPVHPRGVFQAFGDSVKEPFRYKNVRNHGAAAVYKHKGPVGIQQPQRVQQHVNGNHGHEPREHLQNQKRSQHAFSACKTIPGYSVRGQQQK
ncbi:hypothetical protein D3C85_1460750 [compost metagenome]